jgi:hypothetical protein
MLNFCTLFDANYLARGLVTYESLMEATKGTAHLYVFAFDEKCYTVLTKMALPNMTVISLSEFEDEALLAIKPTRTRGEYCWTCTSSTIYYVIKNLGKSNCTYIDADMFFYQNPKVLIDEKPSDKHVIITEHRYTPQYDKSKLSGKYCVQFMYFDDSRESLEVLNWWRERCLEWCYNRHEDGKFGDQKYLDDWTTRFPCVHELKHLGGGLAPWNIQRFDFQSVTNKLVGKVLIKKGLSIPTKTQNSKLKTQNTEGVETQNPKPKTQTEGSDFEAVFFHYHGVKLYAPNNYILAPKMYVLKPEIKALFYMPYLKRLDEASRKVQAIDDTFDSNGTQSLEQYRKDKNKGWGSYFLTNYFNTIFNS